MALKIPKQFRPKGQKSKLYKYKDEILDLREKGYSYDAIREIVEENYKVKVRKESVLKFILNCHKSFRHTQPPKPFYMQEEVATKPTSNSKKETKSEAPKSEAQSTDFSDIEMTEESFAAHGLPPQLLKLGKYMTTPTKPLE